MRGTRSPTSRVLGYSTAGNKMIFHLFTLLHYLEKMKLFLTYSVTSRAMSSPLADLPPHTMLVLVGICLPYSFCSTIPRPTKPLMQVGLRYFTCAFSLLEMM